MGPGELFLLWTYEPMDLWTFFLTAPAAPEPVSMARPEC
jgi:hypothetical protein